MRQPLFVGENEPVACDYSPQGGNVHGCHNSLKIFGLLIRLDWFFSHVQVTNRCVYGHLFHSSSPYENLTEKLHISPCDIFRFE